MIATSLQTQLNHPFKEQGILLIDKPKGKTSFYLVYRLRKITGIKKIGHAGTLDPLATGVMVMLVGQKFTRMTPTLIQHDKTYETRILLGCTTDTYDIDGQIVEKSTIIPSSFEIESVISNFQGKILQTPPMYSAKKHKGKKLYELARKGEEVERAPKEIEVTTEILAYNYPYLDLRISCSSGTYIRTIAHDIGQLLGCGATVFELKRIRSGCFHLNECINIDLLDDENFNYTDYLRSN